VLHRNLSSEMILSKTSGAQFQMDLVDVIPPCNDHHYTLEAVDHLSKFRYFGHLSREWQNFFLLCLLSSSIMPKTLHSDNGAKVCGISYLSVVHCEWF